MHQLRMISPLKKKKKKIQMESISKFSFNLYIFDKLKGKFKILGGALPPLAPPLCVLLRLVEVRTNCPEHPES